MCNPKVSRFPDPRRSSADHCRDGLVNGVERCRTFPGFWLFVYPALWFSGVVRWEFGVVYCFVA